ncbi:hypothetical protein IZ6_07730 [Terrihabitans soli]|uniref:Phage gp6-like head-tail connector protein n=1 Tax=Terrihabitans soli TaxID=708113 RepID=A0A6S6QU87_9HYPH|nr:hypothetical protein [Terrihabitans soli]BCJ90038.1 hypothetical protein IZ6_07730 [Terrihabitans soli]
MIPILITPPEPLVDIDEMKEVLGVYDSDRDDFIASLITAAESEFFGPDGVHVTVAYQVFEVRCASFAAEIELPQGPVIEVVEITYQDGAGVTQTLASSVYELLSDDRLVPAAGQSWPSTSGREEAVKIQYAVGLADDDPRREVAKNAVRTHVKLHFDMKDPPGYRETIRNILAPLRAY